MNADTLLTNPSIIRLESFISEPNAITIIVYSKQKRPVCPNCHQPSLSLQGKLSEEELEILFNARAEWGEFNQAFPLVEELVKIIRRQRSMSIGLWIAKSFDSGVKELRSFANG
jgi:transposase